MIYRIVRIQNGQKKALKDSNSQVAKTFDTYVEAEKMLNRLSAYAEECVEWYLEKISG